MIPAIKRGVLDARAFADVREDQYARTAAPPFYGFTTNRKLDRAFARMTELIAKGEAAQWTIVVLVRGSRVHSASAPSHSLTPVYRILADRSVLPLAPGSGGDSR